jgi:hypothetical protein
VLAHPFLSNKSVVRLVGDKPLFDVFLSYRVNADFQHVEKLYHMLTDEGLRVRNHVYANICVSERLVSFCVFA